jgi:class 3 adenylate cyclase
MRFPDVTVMFVDIVDFTRRSERIAPGHVVEGLNDLTVNTASRMESHGLPGCIQVTCRTYQRLRDHYRLEQRGNNAT